MHLRCQDQREGIPWMLKYKPSAVVASVSSASRRRRIQLPEPQTFPPEKCIKRGQDQAKEHLVYMNCDFEPPPHSRKSKEPNWREGALACCWDPESKPLGLSAYPLKADTSQISESYPLQVREAWARVLRLTQCGKERCPRAGRLPERASGHLPAQLVGVFQGDRLTYNAPPEKWSP